MARTYRTGALEGVMSKLSHDGVRRSYKKTSSRDYNSLKRKFKPRTIKKTLGVKSLGVTILKKVLGTLTSGTDAFGNIAFGGNQYLSSTDAFGNIDFSSIKLPSFGKKKNKDPLFLGKKNDNVKNLEKGDSITDSIGLIYTLFKKIDDEEIKQENLKKLQRTEELLEEEKRHQELIDALESISASKKQSKKKPKVEKLKDTEKKTPPKLTQTTKPSVGGTKIGGMPSATKSIAAGAGIVVAGGVAAKIAKAESAGQKPEAYLTMNRYVKKGEPRTDQGSSNVVKKGNIDITTGKPYDKDLTEMSIQEVIDLGERRKNYFKHSGAGAAAGKYQFMPKTLEGFAKQLTPGSDDWKKIRYTQDTQELLNEMLIGDNAKSLQKAGVPVTDATLYMMHFTGSVKQSKMIFDAPDETPMRDILSKSAIDANPSYATMTVGQYRALLKKKGFDFQIVDVRTPPMKIEQSNTTAPEVKNVNTGEKLLKTSSELDSGKKQNAQNNIAILRNQQIIVNGSNATQQSLAPQDDNPAFFSLRNG